MQYEVDRRDKLWQELEKEIYRRAKDKDFYLRLEGPLKIFVRKQGIYRIYAVNGMWIRNNLCVYFGHGGHHLVHEFIPKYELWISTHHYHESSASIAQCGCKTRTKNQKVSKACFESTIIHEREECELMKKGMPFWKAHQRANKKEKEAGFLQDPYDDT